MLLLLLLLLSYLLDALSINKLKGGNTVAFLCGGVDELQTTSDLCCFVVAAE